MPTPNERRALLFLSSLLLLGAGFRAGRAAHSAPPSTAALDRQLAAVESARQATTARQRGRGKGRGRGSPPPTPAVPFGSAISGAAPPSPPTIYYVQDPDRPVDLDVATAAEIERLPRIGPTLARRIVADRDSLGPFGSLEELRRVKGVGPALAKAIEPHVTFSLQPRPHRVDERGGRGSSTRGRGRSRRPPSP